jgi:signal transduction histidine kinase
VESKQEARLQWEAGMQPAAGECIVLGDEPMIIGRSGQADIVIADREVSGRHAEIGRDEHGYYLRDLGSTNGTFINDRQVRREYLVGGDRIYIGQTVLQFQPSASSNRQGDSNVRYRTRWSDSSSVGIGEDPAHAAIRLAFEAVTQLLDCESEEVLCESLLDTAFELARPETGQIILLDEPGRFVTRAERHRGGRPPIPLSQTVLQAAAGGESILAQDTTTEDRWSAVETLLESGARSLMCVPIQRRDQVLGLIYVTSTATAAAFSERDLDLLTGIGAGAGIVLENVRLRARILERERLASMGLAVGNAAHHLKNLLVAIEGPVRLLEHGLEQENLDEFRTVVPVMRRGTTRMAETVHDMLSLGKTRKPVLAPGSINDLLTEVCSVVQSRAQQAGVDLRLALDPALGEGMIDQAALHAALLNLVGNAIEAHTRESPDGWVVVRSRAGEEGSCRIEIEDNGPGIQPADLTRIFEPFFSTKGSQGTGLGLPMAKQSIEECGGTLEASNVAGGGALFRVTLPLPPRP